MVWLHFKKEYYVFLKWVISGFHFIETPIFYLKKAAQFIKFRRHPYGLMYYPQELGDLLKKGTDSEMSQDWKLPYLESPPGSECPAIEIENLSLASHDYKVHHNTIDWEAEFEDEQDAQVFHRWNWALTLLSQDRFPPASLVRWVSVQMERWIDDFIEELDDKSRCRKSSDRWGGYTTGERVANAVLFFVLAESRPNLKIQEGLKRFCEFLLNNLEYKDPYTGNHVVNNARALYLAGAAFENALWKESALFILNRELPFLVSKDGFLREGSSHYQFMLSRWMLEVFHVAGLIHDYKTTSFIRPWLEKLVPASCFFAAGPGRHDFPLFGDVSPDFAPDWLGGLACAKTATNFIKDGLSRLANDEQAKGSWAALMGYGENGPADNVSSEIIAFPESGWYRAQAHDQRLFMRCDREMPADFINHHHNDLFHFCLYYKKQPVFIDHGRKSYAGADSFSRYGQSAQAHNTVLIDGLSVLPENATKFPVSYARTESQIKTISQGCCHQLISTTDGFKRLGRDINCRRLLTLGEGRFFIEDLFEGGGSHSVAVFLHWAPGLSIARTENNEWKFSSDRITGRFTFDCEAKWQFDEFYGGEGLHGWVSKQYGQMEQAMTFRFAYKVKFPFQHKFTVSWDG